MSKNLGQVNNELAELLRFRDISKVRLWLYHWFKKSSFEKLTLEQTNEALEKLKKLVESGEL